MKPTIGIEVHVELKSLSKVFSNSKNNFNDPVNTNVNVIDLAYPGSLPRLNKEVINMAIKACLALNCDVTRLMHFDRKNYFYADLPKGFQITQQDTPIGTNGYIEIENGKKLELKDYILKKILVKVFILKKHYLILTGPEYHYLK